MALIVKRRDKEFMRKGISILMIVTILTIGNISYAGNSSLFTDVSPYDWHKETVELLVNKGSISGYPDKSFRPDSPMTKAEFIKVLISSLGYKDQAPASSHWASGYIQKAENLNIIDKGWLKNIDSNISRYEMARIISNTLTYRQEKTLGDLSQYKNLISDYQSIPSTLNGETNGKTLPECVLETYVKGIVTGYPNGSFHGGETLTRAEASTVIIRVLDQSMRVKSADSSSTDKFADEVLNLVNKERQKKGIKSLVLSDKLSEAALLKSKDMSIFNYFDHRSPNYGTPFEMIKSLGIQYKFAGENLAKGHKTPAEVVTGWMNSQGHRANILNPSFSKMGIGYYKSSTTYWAQLFTD